MDRKKIFWAIASVFIAILSIWTVVSQSKHFSFEILMSFIINANKGWLFMSFVCYLVLQPIWQIFGYLFGYLFEANFS